MECRLSVRPARRLVLSVPSVGDRTPNLLPLVTLGLFPHPGEQAADQSVNRPCVLARVRSCWR